MAELTDRQSFINGLRELADFLDHNPAITAIPSGVIVNYWAITKEEVAAVARAVKGGWKKD